MKLSIVATLYNSAPYLEAFHRRVTTAAANLTPDYEFILVNDGSPDDSLARAKALAEADTHVTVVDLSRNFGHHKAMMTGLMQAKGDYVFLLDSDLEEPPELLGDFWRELQADKELDVVYGVQRLRKGGLSERLSGSLYYTIFNAMSFLRIERNMSVVRLMTRRFVDNLVQHKECELVFVGLCALTGYKQKSYTFDKTSKGVSSYDFIRKLDLAINSIVSFSAKPLNWIFYLGLSITGVAGLLIVYYIANFFMFGGVVTGFTSLIVSLWALGGLIILSLGVIGIYLSKMFSEVKDRPYTIIRDIHKGGE